MSNPRQAHMHMEVLRKAKERIAQLERELAEAEALWKRTDDSRTLRERDKRSRELLSEFCTEADRVMVLARQLVDGWHNTTPADEWSEFDESTRQEMRKPPKSSSTWRGK